MATKWISEVLSASDHVQCFHGTTGLKHLDGIGNPSSSEVLRTLDWVARDNVGMHVGIVHIPSNHGVNFLEPCNSQNIPFIALVRNPILAIESQYQERLERMQLPRYDRALAVEWQTWKSIIPFEPSRAELIFMRCTRYGLRHLLEIEHNSVPCLRFEEYTKDIEKIWELLSIITRGEIKYDPRIEGSFQSLGAQNRHRKRNKNAGAEEYWGTLWSERQRIVFARLYTAYLNALKVYQRRTCYPIVDDLVNYQ